MCANPALLAAGFDGTLAATDRDGAVTFVGVAPTRYQPATGARINLARNTQFAVDASLWIANSVGSTIDQVADASFDGGFCCEVTTDGSTTFDGISQTVTGLPQIAIDGKGDSFTVSFDVKRISGDTGVQFGIAQYSALGGFLSLEIAGTIAITDTVTRYQVTGSYASTGISKIGFFAVGSTQAVRVFRLSNIVVESGSVTGAQHFDGVALDPITNLLGVANASPVAESVQLWVEQSVANLVPNPWRSFDNTGWSALNGATARTTVYAYEGPGAGLITASAAAAEERISITATAVTHTAQAIVRNLAAASRQCQLTYNGSLIGSPETVAADATEIFADTLTGTGGAANLGVRWLDSANAEQFVTYYLGAELGNNATSPCPAIDSAGTIAAGYAWGSTAHASTSTRTAASASIDPTDRIDQSAGSLAVQVRPTDVTGVEELHGACGVKGVGTDHLRWGRDSAFHPFVEWSSNNAAYQRLTATEFIGFAERVWYLDWSGTAVSLSIDNGTLQTGTRAAVSGSWGAGDLVLQASVGGVALGPLATYERQLTATERLLLNDAIGTDLPLFSLLDPALSPMVDLIFAAPSPVNVFAAPGGD